MRERRRRNSIDNDLNKSILSVHSIEGEWAIHKHIKQELCYFCGDRIKSKPFKNMVCFKHLAHIDCFKDYEKENSSKTP